MIGDIARVCILDVPFFADKIYDYYIPIELDGSIMEGSLVTVPFGMSNKRMRAVTLEVTDSSGYDDLKPVISVSGAEPLLDGEQMKMCQFLKNRTLCTFGDAVRSVVPSAAIARITEYIEPDPKKVYDPKDRTLPQRSVALLAYLAEHGKTPLYKIALEFGEDTDKYVVPLIRAKYAKRCGEVKESTNIKIEYTVVLAASPEVIRGMIDGTTSPALRSEGQKAALETLLITGEMKETELCKVSGCNKVQISSLEKKGLVERRGEEVTRDPYRETADAPPEIELSATQEAAYLRLEELYSGGGAVAALLFGVTGSGKTSVIKKTIDRVRADGRGVIMLVPEIALTPQAVAIFRGYYGDSVCVLHSGLSDGERYDAYRRIKDASCDVVIGTRSAIFAPVKNLGLIVIDEEQEHTYKADSDPKYSAHEVASFRCGESGAMLILSSATPSVGT
ncbi:MAG: DEAD/DEAH box helicase family protein, partial [Clostridia bacterium]|nr:DEAD/DEAH box helicase family protein [Clostridia bacterium]